jgi:hypothetical protein
MPVKLSGLSAIAAVVLYEKDMWFLLAPTRQEEFPPILIWSVQRFDSWSNGGMNLQQMKDTASSLRGNMVYFSGSLERLDLPVYNLLRDRIIEYDANVPLKTLDAVPKYMYVELDSADLRLIGVPKLEMLMPEQQDTIPVEVRIGGILFFEALQQLSKSQDDK